MHVYRGANIDLDRYLLSHIHVRISLNYGKQVKKTIRCETYKLKDPAISQQYNKSMKEKLRNTEPAAKISKRWDMLREIMQDAVREIIGQKTSDK